VPSGLVGEPLLLSLVRTLREAGLGRAAAALLARAADRASNAPELALERSYGTLREGPPERAIPALDSLARIWPPAHFALAEAQFFAGQLDSALANYQRAAANATTPEALTALDRAYLLEERRDDGAALALGRIAFERWRGGTARARVLADSLWKALPRESPCYSRAALQQYELLAEAGEWRAALVPLASVADSMPGDRLAPLARQRAGEAWIALGDDRHALEQFEECLARYPRAWNAAEVRRRVDQLRRDRRL
jgi:tetratricopeptide (TPR) repeat protein